MVASNKLAVAVNLARHQRLDLLEYSLSSSISSPQLVALQRTWAIRMRLHVLDPQATQLRKMTSKRIADVDQIFALERVPHIGAESAFGAEKAKSFRIPLVMHEPFHVLSRQNN